MPEAAFNFTGDGATLSAAAPIAYRSRSATIGSTPAARRAGTQ